MNHVIAIPSRWLRAYAALTRWTLGLLAAVAVTLVLVWMGLHWVIVPRIADLRPWLEARATASLGLGVRIGAIEANTNGLTPSFTLRNVRLQDAQGRETLLLPEVVATLSPRSVLSLGVEQLYIHAPHLEARRSVDGQIWVAGVALAQDSNADTKAADWLFSQTEVVVHHGTLVWTDAQRGLPTVQWSDVDIVLRNSVRSHALRVDASPPTDWGQRVRVMGQFKHPLLSRHVGNWKHWAGQLYVDSAAVHLGPWRDYAGLQLDPFAGHGAVQAWIGVERSVITEATLDLQLHDIVARLSPSLEPIDMAWARGRLAYRKRADGGEYQSQNFAFATRDGVHWPGAAARLTLVDGTGQEGSAAAAVPHGVLSAERLDLAAIARIASRLPLGNALLDRLESVNPRGMVEALQLTWQGQPNALQNYAARGRIRGLQIDPASGNGGHPGLHGGDVDFELTNTGGKATVAMRNGAIFLPDVFEAPELVLDKLSAQLQWERDGSALALDVQKLQFANAHGQGQAQIQWRGDVASSTAQTQKGRLGVVDAQGSLSRLDLKALHRYLPKAMSESGRSYLHAALQAGTASDVQFTLKGNLDRFPFLDGSQGDFRISGSFRDMAFAFAPHQRMAAGSLPWPTLAQASGDLLLDRDSLRISGGKTLFAQNPNLQANRVEVAISKLYDAAVVAVSLDARGPLHDMIGLVNSAPVGQWINQVLARATASGSADYKLKMRLPLQHMDQATVQGAIALADNELQISPDIPRLSALRGQIAFTEGGFTVPGVQAHALGGEVRIDGGLQVDRAEAPPTGATLAPAQARPAPIGLRMQGSATAEGIRQAVELGAAARLAHYASGATQYSALLGLRHGKPALRITSALTGMALALPTPFAKSAETALPVRFETSWLSPSGVAGAKPQERMTLDMGPLASVVYEREFDGAQSRVLRGAIGVGLLDDEAAPLPREGVDANVQLDVLDVDAWLQVVSHMSASAAQAPPSATHISAQAAQYLPTTIAARANALQVQGRRINNVVVGGSREGPLWRANLVATELNGYVQYQQPAGANLGRVYARLAHLNLGPGTAQDVESLLDQQPTSIPALDIAVEDFVLKGKRLGRLDIVATNVSALQSGDGPARHTSREWRLNRLNLTMPEATFAASGTWSSANASAAAQASTLGASDNRNQRRTVLDFSLDVADAGELLARFGMPGVIAKGKGNLTGQVGWMGSPLAMDYPSLGGTVRVDFGSGQFLKADPGLAKLLGVLSLQSLPRRLTLDFRDVFSEGFAFDEVRGDVQIAHGIAHTKNLAMRGVSAAVLMDGQADLEKETQRINVVVVPEINAGSASVLASVVNPVVAFGTFVAQAILRGPLINANTQQFFIDGTWLEPRITKMERK